MPLPKTTKSNSLPNGFSFIERKINEKKESLFLQQIHHLRYKVWQLKGVRMDKIGDSTTWSEDLDHHAHLIGVYKKDELVGTGRLSIHNCIDSLPDKALYKGLEEIFQPPIGSFNRIVVLPKYRRMGIGQFMVMRRLYAAYNYGAKCIAFDSPSQRAASMKKLGFRYVGRSAFGKIFPDVKFHLMTLNLTDKKVLTKFNLIRKNKFHDLSFQ